MPKNGLILTQEGYDQLKRELNELKKVKRPEVIERIKSAQELGDLSENAEYASAKEDQSYIEGRIQELESLLKTAKIHEKNGDSSIVGVGSHVTVTIEGDTIEYQIVDLTENEVESNKISSESPVGRALIGQKAGDKVTVAAPGGDIEYVIIAVK